MSTLISQDDTDYTELVRELMHSDRGISYDTVIKAGLDAELLDETYGTIKPYMDYLRGYKPLDYWFLEDPDALQDSKDAYPGRVPYEDWFLESGLQGQHSHTLLVLEAKVFLRSVIFEGNWGPFVPSEEGKYQGEARCGYRPDAPRRTRFRLFLTRKGKWIVWISWPASAFRVVDNLEDCLKAIDKLLPEGSKLSLISRNESAPSEAYPFLQAYSYGYSRYSITLAIRARLIETFRESVWQKQKDLKPEHDALAALDLVSKRLQ